MVMMLILLSSCSDDHVRLIHVPADLPCKAGLIAQCPQSPSALIRRAAEDDAVFRDEYVIGMAGLARGVAPDGRHELGSVLRVVDVGVIDAPEAAFFPGAVDDVATNVALHIVRAHTVSETVFRTVGMHVERRPEP